MLPATFWRCESSDYEFLLQTSFDLQPIGRSLSRLIDTRFAFSNYAFHPFLLSQLKERLSLAFHIRFEITICDFKLS